MISNNKRKADEVDSDTSKPNSPSKNTKSSPVKTNSTTTTTTTANNKNNNNTANSTNLTETKKHEEVTTTKTALSSSPEIVTKKVKPSVDSPSKMEGIQKEPLTIKPNSSDVHLSPTKTNTTDNNNTTYIPPCSPKNALKENKKEEDHQQEKHDDTKPKSESTNSLSKTTTQVENSKFTTSLEDNKATTSTTGSGGLKPSGLGSFGGGSFLGHSTSTSWGSETPMKTTETNGKTTSSTVATSGFSMFAGSGFGSVKSNGSSIFGFAAAATNSGKTFEDLLETAEDQQEGNEGNEECSAEFTPVVNLQPQSVTTGEEEEITIFQTRCKLYHLDETKQWRERGVGTLKLNASKDAIDVCRLVMRTEAVFKLILNVRVIPNMPCEIVQEKFLRVVACENPPTMTTFLIKLGNVDTAKQLKEQIQEFSEKQ